MEPVVATRSSWEPLLQGLTMVGAGAQWMLARGRHVTVLCISGRMDDAVSDAWRAACEASFEREGVPPFTSFFAPDVVPAHSLSCRARSARFMARWTPHMRRVVVETNAAGCVVLRAMIRAVGPRNFVFLDGSAARAALALMREGVDPMG